MKFILGLTIVILNCAFLFAADETFTPLEKTHSGKDKFLTAQTDKIDKKNISNSKGDLTSIPKSPVKENSLTGFKYDSRGNRDPFTPLVTKEGRYLMESQMRGEIGDVRLEGILWDSNGGISLAIINGMIVKEGDQIGGFKVGKIQKDKLTLWSGGEEHTVELISE